MNKLDRLLFAQGGLCFFCRSPLPAGTASVEHLVATSNGGRNDDENCVVCCTALNRLLGSMSLKEKVQVVLNQQGHFKCPARGVSPKKISDKGKATPKSPPPSRIESALNDLQRRGAARPGSVKTLKSTLHSLFKKKLTDEELASLIGELEITGLVRIVGDKVRYAFPQSGA